MSKLIQGGRVGKQGIVRASSQLDFGHFVIIVK